jgi:hypothetical protein
LPPSVDLRRDAGRRRRAEQDLKAPEKDTFCKIFVPPVGMLLLNLTVWLEAGVRLAAAFQPV